MEYIGERLPFIKSIIDYLYRKEVPLHKFSFFYIFGGLSLFLFLIQLVTGILLVLYYSPDPNTANESVRRIMSDVSFGWLIRSLHVWGSHTMVAVVLIHMFSAFFMKAYRRPREFMWFSGVVIFFLVLGFSFTGYLLPWDVTAYFATQIGTEIPKSLPVIGEIGVQLLRGEGEVGGETLRRMYAIHAVIFPIITVILILFHITLQQILGTSAPVGIELKGHIPFLPNFLYRDFFAWTVLLIVLTVLSTMLPAELGEKADPFASAPVGIKPEWYFLPLYQTLRFVPVTILSQSGEMVVNCVVAIGFLAWFLIPILDKQAKDGYPSPLFTLAGVGLIIYCGITIIAAYLT